LFQALVKKISVCVVLAQQAHYELMLLIHYANCHWYCSIFLQCYNGPKYTFGMYTLLQCFRETATFVARCFSHDVSAVHYWKYVNAAEYISFFFRRYGCYHRLHVCEIRPEHGGKYCIGERRRYRSCNIQVNLRFFITICNS